MEEAEEFPIPDGFLFQVPLFVPLGTGPTPVLLKDAKKVGLFFVPLFTDEDNLKTYIEWSKIPTRDMLVLRTFEEVLLFLERRIPMTATQIAVDPTPRPGKRIGTARFTVAGFIESIRRQLRGAD
jgi:hypothetical protein